MGDARKDRRLGRKNIDDRRKHQKHKIAFAWQDRGRRMAIMKNVMTTETGLPPLTSIQATPACIIAAGQSRPLKICTSGWRKIAETNSRMLDGERWTGLVRSFAATVGFHLYESIRDTPNVKTRVPENAGRYVACHAEKKLGLFFLAHQMKYANVGLRDALKGKLLEVNLPLSRRRARIYLGHKPCKNCRDFLRCIRHHTGIDVRTASGPVFTEHIRKRTFCSGDINTKRGTGSEEAAAKARQNQYDGDSSSDEEEGGMDQPNEDNESRRENEDSLGGHENDQEDSLEMTDKLDPLEAVEAVLETFPVGNVVRPRTPATGSKTDEDNKDSGYDKNNEETDASDVPLPTRPLPASNITVRSSPSPSISLASVLDSSVVDRRDRYPVYTSPSHRGGTAPPPSIWGERSKPPVTPCLEAPDLCMYNPEAMDEHEVTQQSTRMANDQSYFFGTPSAPSEQSVAGAAHANANADANTDTDTNTSAAMAHAPQHQATAQARARQMPVNRARLSPVGSSDTPIMIEDEDEHHAGALSAVSPSLQVLRARAERHHRVQTQQRQRQRQANLARAQSFLEVPSDNCRITDARKLQTHPTARQTAQTALQTSSASQPTRQTWGVSQEWPSSSRYAGSTTLYRPAQGVSLAPFIDLTDDGDKNKNKNDHDGRESSQARPTYAQVRSGRMDINTANRNKTNNDDDDDDDDDNTGGSYIYRQRSGRVFGSVFGSASAPRSHFASPASQLPRQRPQLSTPAAPPPPRQRRRPTAASQRRGTARPINRRGGWGVAASSDQSTRRPFPDLSTFIYDNEAGCI